jgi:thioredoxin-dependent peroxiredoxin
MSHTVLWGGKPTNITGPELKVGDKAPANFTLTANNMSPVTGADLAGKPRIYCTIPSVDTGVCDTELRRFNQEAAKVSGVTIYAISVDLPFAQKRWCGAVGVEQVQTLSDYKDRSFGPAFGTFVADKGLLLRAVFVVDKNDIITHVEYVASVGNEPNYDAALIAAKALL